LLAGLLEGFHKLGVARGERVDARFELMNIACAAQPLGAYRAFELLTQGCRLAAQLF
jgi:hypothetical protein